LSWLLDGLVCHFFIVKSENHFESPLIFGDLGMVDGKVLGVF
jgi:hypothetical protein